jgi:hypothetical protein
MHDQEMGESEERAIGFRVATKRRFITFGNSANLSKENMRRLS